VGRANIPGHSSERLTRMQSRGQSVSDTDNKPQTMVLFPPNTVFFMPNDIHEVTIMFPDAESAIVFYEFCRQVVIDTEKFGYHG
jgi:hypothetical protein